MENGIAVRHRWRRQGQAGGGGGGGGGQWTEEVLLPWFVERDGGGAVEDDGGHLASRSGDVLSVPQRRVFDTQGCGFALWDASLLLARVVNQACNLLISEKKCEGRVEEKQSGVEEARHGLLVESRGEARLLGFLARLRDRSAERHGEDLQQVLEGEDDRSQKAVWSTTTAVELGAGTGLVGMALRVALNRMSDEQAPCSAVFLTDSAPGVLEHLRRVNDCNTGVLSACKACALAAAEEGRRRRGENLRVASAREGCRCGVFVEQMNWGTAVNALPEHLRAASPADILLASDVLYSEDAIDLLVQSFLDLSTPDTLILIANEDHAGVRDLFYDTAERFFHVEILDAGSSRCWPPSLRGEDASKIDVAVLTRRDAGRVEILGERAELSTALAIDNLYSMVHEASKRGNYQQLEQMLDAHPESVSWKDSLGNTCLHWAATGNHTQCAELLLKRGADPRATDAAGLNPIDRALRRRNTALADMMIEFRAATPPSSGERNGDDSDFSFDDDDSSGGDPEE